MGETPSQLHILMSSIGYSIYREADFASMFTGNKKGIPIEVVNLTRSGNGIGQTALGWGHDASGELVIESETPERLTEFIISLGLSGISRLDSGILIGGSRVRIVRGRMVTWHLAMQIPRMCASSRDDLCSCLTKSGGIPNDTIGLIRSRMTPLPTMSYKEIPVPEFPGFSLEIISEKGLVAHGLDVKNPPRAE